MSNIAIKVENLSKVYKLYNDPVDRLKEALHPLRRKYHHDFYALKDVNFEVKKGETIGIIGKNGAGKSTLLKILTGVLTPSSGSVSVHGRISSLLELGVGFNPELTGLENVYFNGAVLGFTKEDIDKKLNSILEFADIGEFVHQPVKTYSSGMTVRLAFAVAVSVDPDILIVDEALAVGDIRFQQKCLRKLKEFKEAGKTILFVTHDTGMVNNYCDRALWLMDGGMHKIGNPDDVTKDYISYMYYGLESEKSDQPTSISKSFSPGVLDLDPVEKCESFGEGGAKITGVGLYSAETGEKIKILNGGEKVNFYVGIEALQDIQNPIIGFVVKDDKGSFIFGTNTYLSNARINNILEGQRFVLSFIFKFPFLRNGDYIFSPAIAEGTQDNHIQHHWVHDSYFVKVLNHAESSKLGWTVLLEENRVEIINI